MKSSAGAFPRNAKQINIPSASKSFDAGFGAFLIGLTLVREDGLRRRSARIHDGERGADAQKKIYWPNASGPDPLHPVNARAIRAPGHDSMSLARQGLTR
jgi:hypothetical protein